MTTPLLEVDDLALSYGGVVHGLRGASVSIPEGGIAALLGSNGAGKTTMLRAITGLGGFHRGQITAGSVRFEGEEIHQLDPAAIVRRGIAQVMEGRRVFAEMSVVDNLRAGAVTVRSRAAVESRLRRVYDLFPVLADRREGQAGYLSGGEQQMLAMGRAMMAEPRLLLLDEPSLGLAPLIVTQIGELIREINEQGTTILLVEQNAAMALDLADRASVIENGRTVREGDADELAGDDEVRAAYLGIGESGGRFSYRERFEAAREATS